MFTIISTYYPQVWVSYAQFELSIGGDDAMSRTRSVYEKGGQELKVNSEKEERLSLLESWKEFEVNKHISVGVSVTKFKFMFTQY